MAICRKGGIRTERLRSLILGYPEVSGPFQMLTRGKYFKWVTLQMQGNLLAHVKLCRRTWRQRRGKGSAPMNENKMVWS